MLDTGTPLIAEFLKDHQQFSRLIYEIAKLLDADKIAEARCRAEELDVVAGPHIAYEEAELYSRLVGLGETSITEEMLVDEHRSMLAALRLLLEEPDLVGETLESVKAGFKSALAHAEHCGSLISLMSRLSEVEQAASLVQLIQLRTQGKKWTDS